MKILFTGGGSGGQLNKLIAPDKLEHKGCPSHQAPNNAQQHTNARTNRYLASFLRHVLNDYLRVKNILV